MKKWTLTSLVAMSQINMHILDLPHDALKLILKDAGNTVNLALVHSVFHECISKPQPLIFDPKIKYYSIQFLQWLYSIYGKRLPDDDILKMAYRYNDLPMLKWCMSKFNLNLEDRMITGPFDFGHSDLKFLTYFLDNGLKRIGKDKSAQFVNIHTGSSLHYSTSQLTSCAASSMNAVKWLINYGFPWCPKTISAAAKHGNLDLIKWAFQQGYDWCPKTTEKAAKYGHLDVIKWCVQRGCPWSPKTISKAARNNHQDIIHWAIMNGANWCQDTLCNAAKYGHLQLFEWCLDVGWPMFMQMNSFYDGSIEEITMMCPRIMEVTLYAAYGGHLDILTCCLKRNIPFLNKTVAGGLKYRNIVEWCYHNIPNFKWHQQTLEDITEVDKDTVQWCLDHGCPPSINTLYYLAIEIDYNMRDYELMEFCLQNNFPWRKKTKRSRQHCYEDRHILCYILSDITCAKDIKWFYEKAGSSFRWGGFTVKDILDTFKNQFTYNDESYIMPFPITHIERAHTHHADSYSKSLHQCNLSTQTAIMWDLVQWCVDRGCRWGGTTIDDFLELLNLQQLEWCRSRECRFTRHTLNRIVNMEMIDVSLLKWAMKIITY